MNKLILDMRPHDKELLRYNMHIINMYMMERGFHESNRFDYFESPYIQLCVDTDNIVVSMKCHTRSALALNDIKITYRDIVEDEWPDIVNMIREEIDKNYETSKKSVSEDELQKAESLRNNIQNLMNDATSKYLIDTYKDLLESINRALVYVESGESK